MERNLYFFVAKRIVYYFRFFHSADESTLPKRRQSFSTAYEEDKINDVDENLCQGMGSRNTHLFVETANKVC